ncbi:MAG: hypothetical protein ACREJT_07730, partial [Myxococcota bacterium]
MTLAYNFHSTDADALTLAGVAGSGIALLDSLLVDGYGSVSVSSITRSGGTVSVTTGTAHNRLVEDVVLIAGATPSDYNGKWKVASVPSSTTLTFAIGTTPTTPATGTITIKKAPLGWTKAFSATNRAAYKMPAGSNGFYLYVDDTATTYMAVSGYETMSDIDTGTGQFPASGSTAVWSKSSTASAVTRNWAAYGDEYWIWFAPCYNANSTTRAALFGFGDLDKTVSTDSYATLLIVCTGTGVTAADSSATYGFLAVNNTPGTTSLGHSLARAYTQLGGTVGAGKNMLGTQGNSAMGGNGYYPYDAASGLMLVDVFVH